MNPYRNVIQKQKKKDSLKKSYRKSTYTLKEHIHTHTHTNQRQVEYGETVVKKENTLVALALGIHA